ncbi:hypothetical protein [Sporomusa ovata]|nr:hypothetical protein [Sporomusa ovata]
MLIVSDIDKRQIQVGQIAAPGKKHNLLRIYVINLALQQPGENLGGPS